MLTRLAALAALTLSTAALADNFTFKDTAGDHLDVFAADKPLARYMYAYDKAKLADTYKPYLHVFDPEGKALITKGPGGQYTHHRGIFIGWNQIKANGKTYDRWHMKGGEQIHKEFSLLTPGDTATFSSVINWMDDANKPLLEEIRTFTFRPAPKGAYALIDVTTAIAPATDLTLGGDPEHAGVHFRPANEVAAKETTYTFPKENADPHKDTDYPWVSLTFTLDGKRYSVVQMSHPANPKPTKWSAYRDYGRFGAFVTKDIEKIESLVLKYRFVVSAGETLPIDTIQQSFDAFAGNKEPSPVPKTTTLGGANRTAKPPAKK